MAQMSLLLGFQNLDLMQERQNVLPNRLTTTQQQITGASIAERTNKAPWQITRKGLLLDGIVMGDVRDEAEVTTMVTWRAMLGVMWMMMRKVTQGGCR